MQGQPSIHPCQRMGPLVGSSNLGWTRQCCSGRVPSNTDKRIFRQVRVKATENDLELLKLHGDLMRQIEERKRLQHKLASQLLEQEGVVIGDPETYREPPSRASASVRTPPPPPRPFKPPAKQRSTRDADMDDLDLLTRQFENQRGQARSLYDRQSSKDTVADPPPEKKEPPLAGENAMKVVLVGAECAPWSKTGGLGDVMSALPKALARRGHRVMVVVPRYANYDNAWDINVRRTYRVFNSDTEVAYFHCFKDGVDYVFVDHPCYHAWAKNIYGGDRLDIQFRCALLCKAALEAPWHVSCGGVPYGDDNLVFIANDWHTALLPVYLQAHYRDYDKMTYARSMFVIHNIAHQGRAPMVELENLEIPPTTGELFRLDDPIGGEHMNIMKAGLITAHRIVAVSHGYAWECQTPEGGWGLDAILREHNWKLRGIVNGIDSKEWNPALDEFLKKDGYANYTLDTLKEGKAKCKAALQKEMGLPVDPNAPMLGFIGRLDYQKGVDLIRDNFNWLMEQNVQLIMLGSGSAELEQVLRDMEASNKDKCRGWVGFSVSMAHRITAAADMLLMPSRFEPCGLNQLYAMAYGTVPIVHAVGGLRDTVAQYNPYDNTGLGWTFDQASADKLREATNNALLTYRDYRDSFDALAKRGMQQDLSWDNAASQYEEIMVAAKYQW